MRTFEMPQNYDTEPSKYAGQERVYENKKMMQTISGKKIIIINYNKDEGLYVVMNIDKPGVTSPAYKIHPDKLVEIEKSEKK